MERSPGRSSVFFLWHSASPKKQTAQKEEPLKIGTIEIQPSPTQADGTIIKFEGHKWGDYPGDSPGNRYSLTLAPKDSRQLGQVALLHAEGVRPTLKIGSVEISADDRDNTWIRLADSRAGVPLTPVDCRVFGLTLLARAEGLDI